MFQNNNTDIMENEMTSERHLQELLWEMTLEEKIGQLSLVNGNGGHITDHLRHDIAGGRTGAVLNEVDVTAVNELQRIAVEDSRLGIPLLIGRDVIHGFKTVFPVPLGQAAAWNPEIVKEGARISALEAAASGVNWTYAPMVDIGRDPRWGRVAETLGEDPFLTSLLTAAMVAGFQGDDLKNPGSIAACVKHFAGYGASESGRDYNTTNIPENELRNVHLTPFKAALDAGVASFMTSFSDLDGIPASANEFLLQQILREEWQYDGFVVSDWDSIRELSVHGLTANDREAAFEAANAGVDMEMASNTYAAHLKGLVEDGLLPIEKIDAMVTNILRIKSRLGLFDNPYTETHALPVPLNPNHLEVAKRAAIESAVLLKNENRTLPLAPSEVASIGVIGPLADDGYEQLGTWIFDGDPDASQTPLKSIREFAGESVDVHFARAMENTRSKNRSGFAEAIEVAWKSDVVILFLGEESILSGEAHCRADIMLPGNQETLIKEIAATGKPVVLVVMAGRPLVLTEVLDKVDALLYMWHPGTMAGPAITDLLFGKVSPAGKLPVTFPRMTGQVPIYYSHKMTGRPPVSGTVTLIDDIESRAHQVSLGNTSFHLDAGKSPLFPFGYGLSYAEFHYSDIRASAHEIMLGESITISAELINSGDCEAEEVAQLYIRDLVGSVTRPVKELKGFQKIRLSLGERTTVTFQIHTDDLAFYNRRMQLATEPGTFHAWIGGSSDTELRCEFEVIESN